MRAVSIVRMTVLIPMSVWAAAALARCQTGTASAPYIGAAAMRRIDRAAAHLPLARKRLVRESVGAPISRTVKRAAVPVAVKKVLPQYEAASYSAFRVDGKLAIANGQGTLSYLLPLGGQRSPGNCP